ncbi:MAG: nucleotidyltransferase family protein [Hymenobacter sp.]
MAVVKPDRRKVRSRSTAVVGWCFFAIAVFVHESYNSRGRHRLAPAPAHHTQPKSLVPVAGNTILGHIIDRLRGAGLTEFVFIIGYLGEKIEQYVRRHYPDLGATFVVQEPREGLGHALWVARDTFRHDPDGVLILLGDTIVDVDLTALLRQPGSVLAVKEVKTPSLFGLVETDEAGLVSRVVEKPRIPKSNYALVGLYKIANAEALAQSLEWLMRHRAAAPTRNTSSPTR